MMLCVAGGWLIDAEPGEMIVFGGGAALWGPYRQVDVPDEYQWDIAGLAYAEPFDPNNPVHLKIRRS